MAQLADRLQIILGLDISQLNGQMNQVRSKGSSLVSFLKDAFSFTLGVGMFDAIKTGIKAVGELSIGFNASMEQNMVAFKAMLGSGEKAKQLLTWITNYSAKTPFQTQDLADSAKMLMALGMEAKKIPTALKSITDMTAYVGGDSDKMNRISYALGEMLTQGTVTSMRMRELTNNSVPAWDLLSKAIGKTTAQTKDLVEKGAVPAKQAVDALLQGMEKRAKDMAVKQSATFKGLITTLKDNVSIAAGKVGYDAFKKLEGAIGDTVKKTKTFTEVFTKSGLKEAIRSVFPDEVANKIINFGNWLNTDIKPELSDIGSLILQIAKDVVDDLTGGMGNGRSAVQDFVKLGLDVLRGVLQWFVDNKWAINAVLVVMIGKFIAGLAFGKVLEFVTAINALRKAFEALKAGETIASVAGGLSKLKNGMGLFSAIATVATNPVALAITAAGGVAAAELYIIDRYNNKIRTLYDTINQFKNIDKNGVKSKEDAKTVQTRNQKATPLIKKLQTLKSQETKDNVQMKVNGKTYSKAETQKFTDLNSSLSLISNTGTPIETRLPKIKALLDKYYPETVKKYGLQVAITKAQKYLSTTTTNFTKARDKAIADIYKKYPLPKEPSNENDSIAMNAYNYKYKQAETAREKAIKALSKSFVLPVGINDKKQASNISQQKKIETQLADLGFTDFSNTGLNKTLKSSEVGAFDYQLKNKSKNQLQSIKNGIAELDKKRANLMKNKPTMPKGMATGLPALKQIENYQKAMKKYNSQLTEINKEEYSKYGITTSNKSIALKEIEKYLSKAKNTKKTTTKTTDANKALRDTINGDGKGNKLSDKIKAVKNEYAKQIQNFINDAKNNLAGNATSKKLYKALYDKGEELKILNKEYTEMSKVDPAAANIIYGQVGSTTAEITKIKDKIKNLNTKIKNAAAKAKAKTAKTNAKSFTQKLKDGITNSTASLSKFLNGNGLKIDAFLNDLKLNPENVLKDYDGVVNAYNQDLSKTQKDKAYYQSLLKGTTTKADRAIIQANINALEKQESDITKKIQDAKTEQVQQLKSQYDRDKGVQSDMLIKWTGLLVDSLTGDVKKNKALIQAVKQQTPVLNTNYSTNNNVSLTEGAVAAGVIKALRYLGINNPNINIDIAGAGISTMATVQNAKLAGHR